MEIVYPTIAIINNMNILSNLNIRSLNSGASTGSAWWAKESKGEILTPLNPANEQVIAEVSVATVDDYERVISTAQQGFEQWRELPAPKRGEIIRALADALREKKADLGALVSLETGKIRQEGEGEVQEMIDIADYAVGLSRMIYGKIIPSERPQHKILEQWHPLGSIGVITAFNFPVAVWAWNAFIAAVCGNTVIWKPSSRTPLCAIAVQHICNQVLEKSGYQGIFNLIIGDKFGKKLVDDKRIPLISFTGSTTVGREVSQKVAARLGKSILELSGNNAVIVDETAKLEKVIPSLVFGAVGTTGQRCTTTRRVIVHQSQFQAVSEGLVKAYQQLRIGDPLETGILVGPLISQDAVEEFQTAIKALKTLGADILFGGRVLDRKGYFVEPTIVHAKKEWDFLQNEIFAPILYLLPYNSLDEALKIHNSVPQGLSSTFFTESLVNAELFMSVKGSDCGIANINIGTSGAEIGGAFGGEKDTGGGREAGSDAWRAYMRRQTSTINWGNELLLAQGIKFDYN